MPVFYFRGHAGWLVSSTKTKVKDSCESSQWSLAGKRLCRNMMEELELKKDWEWKTRKERASASARVHECVCGVRVCECVAVCVCGVRVCACVRAHGCKFVVRVCVYEWVRVCKCVSGCLHRKEISSLHNRWAFFQTGRKSKLLVEISLKMLQRKQFFSFQEKFSFGKEEKSKTGQNAKKIIWLSLLFDGKEPILYNYLLNSFSCLVLVIISW